MRKLQTVVIVALLLVCLAGAQSLPFNDRGAWQASTLYTAGDTYTCSSVKYYVGRTYVSIVGTCSADVAANASVTALNATSISGLPDELLRYSWPRLVNNFYFLSQHMHDTGTYNDWAQISTPGAPGTGKLRVYARANAICWIAPGGSETCTGNVTAGGDASGPISNLSVDKIKGRAVSTAVPTDLQYLGWNNGSSVWEPKALPGSVAPAGSDGDYQKKSGSSLGAANLADDVNGRPFAKKGLGTPAYSLGSSSAPSQGSANAPVYDVALGNRQELALNANVTSSTWAHLRGGDKFSVVLTESSPGSFSHAWPVGTQNACAPWLVANAVTTVDFEVASDGSTVTAKACSVYDPANPGVVFYGLMRGAIPTPASSNLACGFASSTTTWECVDPSGNHYYAVQAKSAVSHQFITSLVNGVLLAAQPDVGDLTATGKLPGNLDLGGNALVNEYLSDTSTGTTAKYLVVLSGASKQVKVAGSTVSGIIGLCANTNGNTCGTSGSASIIIRGRGTCTFANATTEGHYVQADGATGKCNDAGATFPTTGGTVVGQVLETGSAGDHEIRLGAESVPSSSSVTAGCGITVTGSTVAWAPWSPKVGGFAEDFVMSATTANVGVTIHTFTPDNGSFTRTDLSAGTVNPESHPGVIKVAIPTTANPAGRFVVAAATNRVQFRVDQGEWHHMCVIFVSDPAVIHDCRIAPDSASPGTHAIGVRYNPAVGDTNFVAYMYATGAAQTAAFSGSFATGWHQLETWRLNSGVGGNPTVYAMVDEGTPKTFCAAGCDALLTQVPTIAITPQVQVGFNGTAGAGVTAELDFHAMIVCGLTRHQ